jgi:hypothetical protein
MKERDRIWKLLAKKLAGDASEKELRELEEILKEHPDRSYSIQLLIDIWEPSPPGTDAAADKAFEEHLRRLAAYQRSIGRASRYKPPGDG